MANNYLKFNNLNKGKLTHKATKRTSIDSYNGFCAEINNFLPGLYGGYFKRFGTFFSKSLSTAKRRGFELQTTNNKNFAIYLLDDGTIEIYELLIEDHIKTFREVSQPVALSHSLDIDTVDHVQIGNSLFFVDGDNHPQQFIYGGADIFEIFDVPFNTYPMIIDSNTITLRVSGSTTLIASDDLFTSDDIGRHFMMAAASASYTWAYGKITGYTDEKTVTVEWLSPPDIPDVKPEGITTATYVWRLGIFESGSYPTKIGVAGGRLYLGGYKNNVNTVSISRANFPFDFSTVDFDTGTTSDDDGISAEILSDNGFLLRFLQQDSIGMQCGTSKGVFSIMSGSNTNAITPTSFRVNKTSSEGSANTKPVQVGSTIVLSHGELKNIHALFYDGNSGAYNMVDISRFADDYFYEDIKKIQVVNAEHNYIFALNNIGEVFVCLYALEDQLTPWVKLTFKDSDFVEDIVSINNTVSFVINRVVNGSQVKYLEIATDIADNSKFQEDIVALDSCIVNKDEIAFNTAVAVGQTLAITVEDTTGITLGDNYFFTTILDYSIKRTGEVIAINPTTKVVTFDFDYDDGFEFDFSILVRETSFGRAYKTGISVPDLSHLEGCTVTALINNNSVEKLTVSSGTIDASDYDIWNIQVGYPIESYSESVDYSLEKDAILQYKIVKCSIVLFNSLGGEIKTNNDRSEYKKILSYTPDVPFTTYIDLKSREEDLNISDGTDKNKRLIIRHTDPYPFYVVGYYLKIEQNNES